MKRHINKTIAAAAVATIVVSLSLLPSCKGRRMSDMVPTGDTVEVEVGQVTDSADIAPAAPVAPEAPEAPAEDGTVTVADSAIVPSV